MKITFHDSRRVINLPSREEIAQAESQTQPPEFAENAAGGPTAEPPAAANDVAASTEPEAAPGAARRAAEAAPAAAAVPSAGAASPFLPLLLGLLALALWLGHQLWQLASDRETLQAAQAAQQPTMDNAAKLRASLDTLAADTQRLADAGNGNARLLVDELKKRGVTINPQGAQGR